MTRIAAAAATDKINSDETAIKNATAKENGLKCPPKYFPTTMVKHFQAFSYRKRAHLLYSITAY